MSIGPTVIGHIRPCIGPVKLVYVRYVIRILLTSFELYLFCTHHDVHRTHGHIRPCIGPVRSKGKKNTHGESL